MSLTLISGASGFVGRGFVNRLQADAGGFTVATFDQDVTDTAAFAAWLTTLPDVPTSYFHFAGISSVGECQKDPARCDAVNAVAPALLAAALWRQFPKCLFFCNLKTNNFFVKQISPLIYQ